jgi:uncharacterized protein
MTSTIDGRCYQQMILAGANRVIARQDELNKINVFPVPDGDTGSNMAFTFASIANQIHLDDDKNEGINVLSARYADAAINGAHGNSGSILAQFFQGLSQGFEQTETLDLDLFAKTANAAALSARNAIESPVEGTIITVMHDWAEWLVQNHTQFKDFQSGFTQGLTVAETSLANTPNLLKILLKNNVVDAGAQGFVHFLQGVNDFLLIGHIDEIVKKQHDSDDQDVVCYETEEEIHLEPHENDINSIENLHYQYCTECIIFGDRLSINDIRHALASWGNSLVVVGNPHKVKIHLHTSAPEKVFRIAGDYGELVEKKAEDMWAQYRSAMHWTCNKQVAVVTDSACNLPQEFLVRHNIFTLPLQVIINNESYLDGININRKKFLDVLTNDQNTVSTSQATVADIKAIYEKALSQSKAIVMICISSGLSGTCNSLKNVAGRFEEENITVIDSLNAAAGQGLVVAAAAQAVQAGKPLDAVIEITKRATQYLKHFISPNTLKYAIRGGRVKRSVGLFATFFRLLPILCFDETGKIVKAGIAFTSFLNRRKMLEMACTYADTLKNPQWSVNHVANYRLAKRIARKLKRRYHLLEEPMIVQTPPVLATHVGPGTVSVAVTEGE